MIAIIAGWLVKAGLSEKFAKPAAIGGGVLLALLAFGAWLHFHDGRVISTNDAQVAVSVQTEGRKADTAAAVQREVDRARATTEQTQLSTILTKGPDNANQASLPDARRAFYHCIRLQQQARDRGGPPPAC